MKTVKSLGLTLGFLGLTLMPFMTNNASAATPDAQNNLRINGHFDQSMRTMRDQMDRLFRDFFSKDDVAGWSGTFVSTPAADIIEEDKNFIVKVEIPGMTADSIDLSATGNALVLKGEKGQSSETKNESYLRQEMSYGSFSRTITLPETADLDKADALYKDGVLTITVPKNPAVASKSRKLTIRQ